MSQLCTHPILVNGDHLIPFVLLEFVRFGEVGEQEVEARIVRIVVRPLIAHFEAFANTDRFALCTRTIFICILLSNRHLL